MSLDLYPRRIYFDGRCGCVWNKPHMLYLTEAPAIPGIRVVEIDYAPGIVAQLREHAGAMRDMTPAEVAACDALLRDVRREAEGTP